MARMHHRNTLVVLGLGLLVAGPALAAPPAAADRSPASQCPALFGGEQNHQRNAARRQRLVDWIEEDEDGVTIVHTSHAWRKDPYPLHLRGLRLVRVAGGQATFELDAAAAAHTGCRAGVYRLGVDSSLSRRTRVLAVLSSVVLVEHHGRLAFIAPAGADVPGRWLLAWRMDGELPPGVGSLIAPSIGSVVF